MKKIFPLLLIAASYLPACCMFNNVRHPDDKLNVAEKLERETVALVAWVNDDGDILTKNDPGVELRSYCTGVWVNDDTIVTAEHCVDDLGKPESMMFLSKLGIHTKEELEWSPVSQTLEYSAFGDVKDNSLTKTRNSRPARVIAADKALDLALVRATKDAMHEKLPSHMVASFASGARVGDDVHIVGHTVGMWWSYMRGTVAQLRPHQMNSNDNYINAIQISAPIFFGDSGGGAFNADGELIGIMLWIKNAPNVGFVIRYDMVKDYVQKNNVR